MSRIYTIVDLDGWSVKGHPFNHVYGVVSDAFKHCNNPKNPQYHDYGGRGIKCFWTDKVEMGLWILNNIGPKPPDKDCIDRYPDNDGDYCPGNLRWATWEESNANQRPRKSAKVFSYKGKDFTQTQLCTILSEETGLPYSTIRSRIRRGWTLVDDVLTPPDSN